MLGGSLLNARRIFPSRKAIPESWYHSEKLDPTARVKIRFMGTAGFVFEGDGRTIVVDPYVTRPSIAKHLRKLKPNRKLVRELFPKADDVLVGHSHSDHILDAPLICELTGARLIGSASTKIIAKAAGLPDRQVLCTEGNEWIQSGNARLKGIPSLHGKATIGPWTGIPLPGEVSENFVWPAHFLAMRHGAVLDWHLEVAGQSIVHIDSADYQDDQLQGIKADILCLCAAGWQNRPSYVSRAIELLRPKVIIPCHWDNFFKPFRARPAQMRGVDLEGFLAEIRKHGIEPALIPIGGELGVS